MTHLGVRLSGVVQYEQVPVGELLQALWDLEVEVDGNCWQSEDPTNLICLPHQVGVRLNEIHLLVPELRIVRSPRFRHMVVLAGVEVKEIVLRR
jgi:hypothetical protein